MSGRWERIKEQGSWGPNGMVQKLSPKPRLGAEGQMGLGSNPDTIAGEAVSSLSLGLLLWQATLSLEGF